MNTDYFALMISPCGNNAAWIHKLDFKANPATVSKYMGWIDASALNDEQFEDLICRLQTEKAKEDALNPDISQASKK